MDLKISIWPYHIISNVYSVWILIINKDRYNENYLRITFYLLKQEKCNYKKPILGEYIYLHYYLLIIRTGYYWIIINNNNIII